MSAVKNRNVYRTNMLVWHMARGGELHLCRRGGAFIGGGGYGQLLHLLARAAGGGGGGCGGSGSCGRRPGCGRNATGVGVADSAAPPPVP